MIVFVIGPSKAGKTAATTFLAANAAECGAPGHVVRVDLDEELGPANRGIGERAVQFCENIDDVPGMVILVDVGAGQLVSHTFQEYLRGAAPHVVIVVVDCGQPTFFERHGQNAPNEVWRYYGNGSLEPWWVNAANQNRLVNSNGIYCPDRWARQLAGIIAAG
jgi:hypothetical protein